MDPAHYTYDLKNGIKVVIVPRKTSGLVYVSLIMRNGKLDETNHTLGFTHIGEHLLAKYTSKKFPRYEGVKGQLGFLGVENNAYTSIYDTGYWLLGNKKHLPFMLNLLSSAFFEYKFTDEWPKQRNIVMEELKSRNSHIWAPLDEEIVKKLFPNHRLGVSWRDELKCVARSSLRDVLDYNTKKWDPKCTLLLVEGDVEAGIVLSDLQKHFDRPKSSVNYEQKIEKIELFKGPLVIRKSIPASAVTKLLFIYQLPNMSRFEHKLDASIMMMLKYFCSGYYSRLYQLLREKNGLIYGLESEYDLSPVPDSFPGLLKIEIRIDPKHVNKVIDIVEDEIDRLKKFLVPRREMLRIKNNLQFQKSMEILNRKPGKFVENCAYYIEWGQPVQTFTDYYEELRKVKSREIQGVAKRIFKKEHQMIAIGEGEDQKITKSKPHKK
jgi:predicted Zn-dependent peptidase